MFKTQASKGKGSKAFERNVTSLPEDDVFQKINDSGFSIDFTTTSFTGKCCKRKIL